jgi:hypothetical protein
MKKKILIISYYYPPSNLTASNRPYFWAKHLAKCGYDVSVISRHWDKNTGSFSEIESCKSDDADTFNQEEGIKVYRVSEHVSFLRKLRSNSLLKKVKISQLITLLDILVKNIFPSTSEYKYFDKKAKELFLKSKFDTLLISGGPHSQFYIGYNLKKVYPNLQWIADYRDEWNSMVNLESKQRLLKIVDSYFEKKWTSNIECFTYVNDVYLKRLSKFIKKPGFVIENGFNPPLIITEKTENSFLTFTFLGTLYPYQQIDEISLILKKIESLISKKIAINFIGSLIDEKAGKRIEEEFNWCTYLNITKRIPREETINYISNTDVFLMFPFIGMSGIIPTKVFDYLPYKKPILFFPKDKGKIDELLEETNLDFKGNVKDEIINSIVNCINFNNFGNDKIKKYSREYSCKKLIDVIEKTHNSTLK